MLTETEFVRRIARQFPVRPPVEIGIGDDGAVLAIPNGSAQIVVTDMLLDGVHFELHVTPVALVGRKAIAVNLSDLAAMACHPTAAFVSIALPRSDHTDNLLCELYAGIQSLADEFDFTIAGGDTNIWNGPFAINVCMTGTPYGKRPVLRSGAQSGDQLVVTGPLGGSLTSGRHLTFTPQLELSRLLSEFSTIHAMMDISDGLAIDLHRLAEASNVGAIIEAAAVPVHADVPNGLTLEARRNAALSDGEDFELLLAVPAESIEVLRKARSEFDDGSLHVIGQVTDSPGCQIQHANGQVDDLPATGWQHLCGQ